MFDNLFILIYFCLIIALQSSIGVGILVLGTPFLLILDYNIVEIFFILLPISIITSLVNIVIIKYHKKSDENRISKDLIKFFLICIPSIIVGLFILKNFQNYINFNFLVSVVIILSIFLVILETKIKFKINFFRKSILIFVGIIHGLTNSGGTLMSLALSSNNKKNFARYYITFFYFVLASFQYLITFIIFKNNFIFPYNFNLIWLIPFGILIGNLLNNFVSEKIYKLVINVLAIITSIILLINS
tara:strand:- start:1329 stop:2063 length:735 start_codon:yes stop_codon:yes gene_type:complete